MDLLDFYRGTLSARRLGVLVKHLPRDSALVRALNDGETPFNRLENLVADLWALWASSASKKVDHPVRAAQQEKARAAAKQARVIELRAKFETRKKIYGLG